VDVTAAIALVAFAVVVGGYGTIIGAGGGFVLIPGLMLAFDLDPAEAVGTGAVTLLAIGVSGAWAYDRAGLVDRAAVGRFALGSVPTALLCGWLLSARIDHGVFTGLLAIVLLALAVFVVAMPTRPPPGRSTGSDRSLRLLPGGGVVVGFLAGTFAVGGGLVTLPIMARARGLAPHRAAATTAGASMLGTIGAASGHVMAGNVVWSRAWLLILGAAAGSAVGARTAHRIPARAVLVLVSGGLLAAAIPLLVN